MAAKLTSTGITFSDSTSLNSKYGIIPQNSVSVFFQSSAPTGWTKNNTSTVNDKALRVVSGTGGGTGGTTAFSSIFPNSLRPITQSSIPMTGSVGGTTLGTPQLPSHNHPNGGFVGLTYTGGGDVGYASGWSRSSPTTGNGPSPSDQPHSHPWSGTAEFSSSLDLRLQYIDVIVCTFD